MVANSDDKVRQIAALTGVSFDDVHRILDAQTDFLVAVDLCPEADEGQRDGLLRKYPDLLRESAIKGMGCSEERPVEFELEALITQLQSGMPAKAVTDVLATFHEINHLVHPSDAAEYRRWAKGWIAR
jgi:hypothetical protein